MDTINNNHVKDTATDEAFFKYIFLKKEKLTSALYLITSFITDQEPVKWKLREKGLELLSDISSARNSSGFYRVAVLEKVDQAVEEISSLLDIASIGGFVSEMNAAILKKEYQGFSQVIKDRFGARPLEALLAAPVPEISAESVVKQETALIQNESASITKPAPAVSTNNINISHNYNSQPSINRKQHNQSRVSEHPEVKDEARNNAPKITLRHNGHDDNLPLRRPAGDLSLKDKEIINPYQVHTLGHQSAPRRGENSRQESILKFIRGRGWTPISDIASAVPDVSVKTVQRELAELVASGVLKKTGERRWSRYILARA